MKKWANIEHRLVPCLFLAALLLVWQAVVESGLIARYILPSPQDVVIALVEILPVLKGHIMVTLQEALAGFGIAILLAIVLAVVMDNVPLVKKALYPLIIISQTVPIIALAPLFGMWFGYYMLPKIIVVVLVCFFPIVISLLHGLGSADKDMLNLLKSMGASRLQVFRLVKFPASMVNFFSGLRIAATYSIMGAVIGEWLGGTAGLGLYMLRAKHSYALDRVFATILVIVLFSMAVFQVISLMQYLLMPWQRKMQNDK
ncbi:MAG: ABC transporter permease [Thermoanaerobacteraceae bacterium]|nr:ABC transporter permease [Thermoanaerobacteraceae bacterium]